MDYFDEYAYGDFADYYYGEMMPSTGYLTVWDILPADGGFVFVYPDDGNPEICAKVPPMPNFFSVFNEGERWGELMECQTVADLNDLTNSGRIRELIRVNEALHEKRFSQVADQVCQRGAKAVLLAGPSSSGQDNLGEPSCHPAPRPWEKAHSHESGRLLHRPGQNCPRP